MEDLERLQKALRRGNILLYKLFGKELECSVINQGIVSDNFKIKDSILATALAKQGVNGIVEGSNFEKLKNTYANFSLHVKSQILFSQLQLQSYQQSA